MINFYDIAYGTGVTLASPFWLLKPSARRKVLRAFAERMGQGVASREGDGPAVMIHAVSLGEMNATRELVRQIREARPDARVYVSTTTDTGYDRGVKLYGDGSATVIRFPLDFTGAVTRVLDAIRPSVVVLMELEVWPNFMRQCGKRGIPVMVINARLTPHSWKRYHLIRPVAKGMFSKLAAVGAQEEGYAGQFVALGVPADRVSVTGTMKFDTAEVADSVAGAAEMGKELGVNEEDPLWVCGSTGPGEERIVLGAYGELLKEFPGLKLAIIPRHPERFDEVAGEIERAGYNVRRRSGKAAASQAGRTTVLLGDTMGELRKFYSFASVVLVGRSLVDLGSRQRGSDMIEPVALGRPTVVGPWTQNFGEVMNALKAGRGIVEIGGPDRLKEAVAGLLRDPASAAEMGRRGQEAVKKNKGATAKHVKMILDSLERA